MSRHRSHHDSAAEADRSGAFIRILASELRDPLMIADAALGHVQSEADSDRLQTISEAHTRMSNRLDDMMAFARRGITVRDTQPLDLETVARRRWERIQTGDATLSVESTQRLQAEPQLFGLLLDRLFRSLLKYRLMSSRSMGEAVSTETARSGMGSTPGSQLIVVSSGETASGYGFSLGIDGVCSPSTTTDVPPFSEHAAEPVGTAAIDVARDIVVNHGWSMQVIHNDSSVRIEISNSESTVCGDSGFARDKV